MANKQMKLKVQFDKSDKYSGSMKSLANFFIENSSIFFEPNGEDAEYPDSISCNISTDFGIDNYGRLTRLCAKYEDLSDERFKPYRVLSASYASYTMSYDHNTSTGNGINGLTIKAAMPGEEGNGYSIKIIINAQAPTKEIEVLKDGTSIGRATIPDTYMTKLGGGEFVLYSSYLDYLTLDNDKQVLQYVRLSGGSRCYYKVADSAYSSHIEVGPTTGGSDDISYNDIDYEVSDDFGVLKCNTVLCKAKSNIKLYTASGTDESGNVVWEELISFNIPITITPVISDKYVNDDDSVVPQSFDSNVMTIVDIANRDNKKYDFQLRTSSFTVGIADGLSNGITKAYNLYYKVGICPIDGKDETRDKILEYLKHQAIAIDSRYNAPKFTVAFAPWKSEIYAASSWVGSLSFINDDDGLYADQLLPTAIAIPIVQGDYDNNYKPIAIMYAKLCNNDGSYFTQSIHYGDKSTFVTFHARTSENQRLTDNRYNENDQLAEPVPGLYLHFEDPNITGFIRSNGFYPDGK